MSDRLIYHLGNVDKDTRICLKILMNMILENKKTINPEVKRAIEHTDKKMNKIINQANSIVEVVDALEDAYKDMYNLPKRIIETVFSDIAEQRMRIIKECEKVDKVLEEKLIELTNIKEWFREIFKDKKEIVILDLKNGQKIEGLRITTKEFKR